MPLNIVTIASGLCLPNDLDATDASRFPSPSMDTARIALIHVLSSGWKEAPCKR